MWSDARYEADLALTLSKGRSRSNRLVADSLEADWNGKLRALAVAQEAYEKAKAADASVVTDAERAELMALSTDFPRLWRDRRTQMRREKTHAAAVDPEDVTLTKGDALHDDIRFAGGATRSLDIPLPKSCMELRTTDAEVVKQIDGLIDTYTDGEIADVLNERGVRTRGDNSVDGRAHRPAAHDLPSHRSANAPAGPGASDPARCGSPLWHCAVTRTPMAAAAGSLASRAPH